MPVSRGRSLLASVIGWLLVAVVAYILFGWLLGTIWFILRMVAILVVVGALAALYFKVRGDESR